METKIDKILEHIHSMDITLARNTDSLELHVKRTNILESQVKEVQRHTHLVEGGFKLLGLLSLILGIIGGLIHVFK